MSNRLKAALLGATAFTITTAIMMPQAHAGMDGNPFEGLYVGFNANYSRVKSTNTYQDLDGAAVDKNLFTGIGNSKKNNGYGGALYGGIGTNIWGPLYTSIEGSLGLAGGSGTAVTNTTTIPTDDTPAQAGTSTMKLKAGFAFDINARLGFTVADRVLVYGLGGYTSTKFKASDSTGNFSKSLGGYRYGAGFEIGIMEDVAVRVEYVRTEHSKLTWVRNQDQFTFDPSTEVFRIGLVLHMD